MAADAVQIRRMSPAKINLFLQVTGRRPDGYHHLLSLMCCIGIQDRVTLLTGQDRTLVVCGHPQVPEDRTNLAVRAAEAFYDALGFPGGVSITIEKNIPVGAGLGGGSSNAATVLNALNRHHGMPFTAAHLSHMGLGIGADVPFFIHGVPALVSGIGETVEPWPNLTLHPLVVIFPGVAVSTAAVYKNLNLALTKCKKKRIHHNLSARRFDVRRDMCNDLESAALEICPAIRKAREALVDRGAMGVLMAGSGSSVFGVFADEQGARWAAGGLARSAGWRVFETGMIV